VEGRKEKEKGRQEHEKGNLLWIILFCGYNKYIKGY
jgi:hypothetical protein